MGAGLNLMLATDVRIVARDAKIISGFIPIGLHPGGGHSALLGRTGAREAAAAMALFGERIDGERAAALGLAWMAVDDADVEQTAIDLAARAGADPELARRTAASLRTVLGPPPLPWPPRSSWSAPPRCGRCAGRRSAEPGPSAASRARAVSQ